MDTNLLLYAADDTHRDYDRCRALLDQWRIGAEPCYLTGGIIYEFARVATHPKVFRSPWPISKAWGFVSRLLAAPAVDVLVETDRHAAVAAEFFDKVPNLAGSILHDAHTAVLMFEHGIRRIYTRDTDFHRFPGIEVIDPLAKA